MTRRHFPGGLSVNVNSEAKVRLRGTKRNAVVTRSPHFLQINSMFSLRRVEVVCVCVRELTGECKYRMIKKAIQDECVLHSRSTCLATLGYWEIRNKCVLAATVV